MKLLSSREFKLFISFLLIYSIFAHWVGWNEQTRLLSAISFVDEGKLSINDYAKFSGDRVIFNGSYYSDKPPGSSLFLMPIYSLSKAVTSDRYNPSDKGKILLAEPQFNTTIFVDKNPGNAVLLTSLLGTVLLSSLPGALLVVLIYRTVLEIKKDKKTALITSIVFGLGTILFSYSTVLMGNILSLFFVFLSFYLVYIKNGRTRPRLLVSGVFLGLSVSIDYLSSVFAVIFLIFIFLKSHRSLPCLIVGAAIGAAPFLIYNSITFGNPLAFYENYLDPKITPCAYGTQYLGICPESTPTSLENIYLTALELLFRPYRGLFFYMPFILFSFIGSFYLYRKNKGLTFLVFSNFAAYFILNSLYIYWFGGSAFGSKYLLNTLPLLSIPFASFVKENKRLFLSAVCYALVLISVFNIILGTAGFWEGIVVYASKVGILLRVEWYKEGVFWTDSFRKLNPLYDHYLPALINDGPRSRAFEQLLVSGLPDIRDLSPIPARELALFATPYGIITMSTPFLILPLLLSILLIVWHKEFAGNRYIAYLLLFLVFLLVLSRIGISNVVFDKNWHPLTYNQSFRFMSNKTDLSIFSAANKSELLNISIGTFFRPKTLDLRLNNNSLGHFVIRSFNDSILIPVNLVKGVNNFEFSSMDGCDYPIYLVNNSKDWRCLSFAVKNISAINDTLFSASSTTLFTNNWQSSPSNTAENVRWAYNNTNATILFYSRMPEENRIAMNITSYNNYRNVYVYLNGRLVDAIDAAPLTTEYVSKSLGFKEGLNEIGLYSEGCLSPRIVQNSSDERCLSYGISGFGITRITPTMLTLVFGKGFYSQKNLEILGTDSFLYIFSPRSDKVYLHFSAQSYYKNRDAEFILNNHTVTLSKIEQSSKEFLMPLEIASGDNTLEIRTKDCDIPQQKENIMDVRCISVSLSNLELIKYNETDNSMFFTNSYVAETTGNARWLTDGSNITMFSSKPRISTLAFNTTSYYTPRITMFYLNGYQFPSEAIPSDQDRQISYLTLLKKGENDAVFSARPKCNSPSATEFSMDKRCLSVILKNFQLGDSTNYLTLLSKTFESGWHDLETASDYKFRWISNNATIHLLNPTNQTIKVTMAFSSWSYYKNRTLNVIFDNEQSYSLSLMAGARNAYSIDTSVRPGMNILTLNVPEGCDIPFVLENSDDKRCLSAAISNLDFEVPSYEVVQ